MLLDTIRLALGCERPANHGLVRGHPFRTPQAMYFPIQIWRAGTDLYIAKYVEFILPTTQSLQLAAAISVQKILLLHLAMEPTALPTFQNLPTRLYEPFLRAVRSNPLQ